MLMKKGAIAALSDKAGRQRYGFVMSKQEMISNEVEEERCRRGENPNRFDNLGRNIMLTINPPALYSKGEAGAQSMGGLASTLSLSLTP